ncbi:MAG: hypothetical protein E6593_00295 [Clostridium sp.]|nr:hypothetical protein [Clostridium sp.]
MVYQTAKDTVQIIWMNGLKLIIVERERVTEIENGMDKAKSAYRTICFWHMLKKCCVSNVTMLQ